MDSSLRAGLVGPDSDLGLERPDESTRTPWADAGFVGQERTGPGEASLPEVDCEGEGAPRRDAYFSVQGRWLYLPRTASDVKVANLPGEAGALTGSDFERNSAETRGGHPFG